MRYLLWKHQIIMRAFHACAEWQYSSVEWRYYRSVNYRGLDSAWHWYRTKCKSRCGVWRREKEREWWQWEARTQLLHKDDEVRRRLYARDLVNLTFIYSAHARKRLLMVMLLSATDYYCCTPTRVRMPRSTVRSLNTKCVCQRIANI